MSIGKAIENFANSIRSSIGAWRCRTKWRTVEPRKIVFDQFHGGGFGCNQKYIALELLRRRSDLDLVWLARDTKSAGLPDGIRVVPWRGWDAVRELATAKVWCSNHNLGNFISHRGLIKKSGQLYFQTWHGSFGIKRCTDTLAPKETAMLDGFFANCDWEASLARGWFGKGPAIHVLGHPRNDIVVQSRGRAFPSTEMTLLYAPTFRDDGDMEPYLTDFTGVVEALERRWGGKWKVRARLHPNMKKKGRRLKFKGDVEDVTDHPDIQELLAQADVVISDYSSCIFDFALSRRPAFLYVPDREKYETERGFYYPLSETPFPVVEGPDELAAAIKYFDGDEYAEAVEEFLSEKGNADDGNASSRAADVILGAMGRD